MVFIFHGFLTVVDIVSVPQLVIDPLPVSIALPTTTILPPPLQPSPIVAQPPPSSSQLSVPGLGTPLQSSQESSPGDASAGFVLCLCLLYLIC